MDGARERPRGYSSRPWRGIVALLGFAAVIAITVPAAGGVTRHAFKETHGTRAAWHQKCCS